MKKLLLAFMAVVGFAQQVTASMWDSILESLRMQQPSRQYEMMYDLIKMNSILEQMRNEAQQEEERREQQRIQQKKAEKQLFVEKIEKEILQINASDSLFLLEAQREYGLKQQGLVDYEKELFKKSEEIRLELEGKVKEEVDILEEKMLKKMGSGKKISPDDPEVQQARQAIESYRGAAQFDFDHITDKRDENGSKIVKYSKLEVRQQWVKDFQKHTLMNAPIMVIKEAIFREKANRE